MKRKIIKTLLGTVAGWAVWIPMAMVVGASLPDAMLSYSGAAFSIVLIPAMIENRRKKTAITITSALSTVVLLAMMLPGFIMLGAWFTVTTSAMTATAWAILTVQAALYAKPSNTPGALEKMR